MNLFKTDNLVHLLAPLGLRDLKLNNGVDIVSDSRCTEGHVRLKLALKFKSSGLLLIKTSEGSTLHLNLLFFIIVFTGESRLNRETDTPVLLLDEGAFNHTLHTTVVLFFLLMRHAVTELLSLDKNFFHAAMVFEFVVGWHHGGKHLRDRSTILELLGHVPS